MQLILGSQIFFLFMSTAALATPAPKPGETMGASEYSVLLPVGRAGADHSAYSEGLRFGGSSVSYLPFGFALDFGFLNSQKQRYTQISLFNFGKQPIPSGHIDGYYRAELFSFGWAEADGPWYAPGIEIGLVITAWQKTAFALSGRATIDRSSRSPPIFIFCLSFINETVYKPLAEPASLLSRSISNSYFLDPVYPAPL
jgi:hypothetical protein